MGYTDEEDDDLPDAPPIQLIKETFSTITTKVKDSDSEQNNSNRRQN